jgi:hypothetical protein
MTKKSRRLFNNERLKEPSVRKRLDVAIVIAGLIVALVFGVLTWINYQDRKGPSSAQISEAVRIA